MKNAPAAVKNFVVANNVAWRADLYTVTLLDGTVYRWTNTNASITIGGNTYLANGAVLSRGNLRSTSELEVDNLELILSGPFNLPTSLTIAKSALLGVFDEARVRVDHLVGAYPGDLSLGVVGAYYEGRVAGLDPAADLLHLMVVSDLEQLINRQIPLFTYAPSCGYTVYDANCGVSKAAFTIAGTASGVPTASVIPTATPAITAKPINYFNLGVIAFTSGALAGSRRAIESWSGTQFTTARPFLSAPAAGDSFNVYPGCALTETECTKFSNLIRFGGFDHVPTNEGGT